MWKVNYFKTNEDFTTNYLLRTIYYELFIFIFTGECGESTILKQMMILLQTIYYEL